MGELSANVVAMALNLEPEKGRPVKGKKYKAAIGFGSIVGLFGIGSTLAANISLNGGDNIEFGQGVANTAACDQDGFTITPITSYYGSAGVFKVDEVQITGLNLTPQGTGWDDSDNGESYVDQDAAIADRPGEYWDDAEGEWLRTCDGVVLDFKAYTDDEDYINRTSYEYGETVGDLARPLGWYQWIEDDEYNLSPGFAIIIDTDNSGVFDSNYAVDSVTGDYYDSYGDPYDMGWSVNSGINTSDASFSFYVVSDNAKTLAGSISKITVQSMATFPSSYYAIDSGLGDPAIWD
jgi:hypothetical protein